MLKLLFTALAASILWTIVSYDANAATEAAADTLPVRIVMATDGKKLAIHCGDWSTMVETANTVGPERFLDLVEQRFGKDDYHTIIARDAAGYGMGHTTESYAQVMGYCYEESAAYWQREAGAGI